jgi:hypothetical protein
MRVKSIALPLVAVALGAASAAPATAACKKFAFEVNDYGKDGPTRDAKALLDKHIATWAKEHSISHYTVGKKDVTCELFLNLIVVDEHTCRAIATVCWQGPDPDAPAPVKAPVKAPAKPAAKPKAATAPTRSTM